MRLEILGNFVRAAFFIGAVLTSCAQGGNSNTTIKLPLISGTGSPTSLGLGCSASNYGQPYQDTSVIPNVFYTCGREGWAQRAGLEEHNPTFTGNLTGSKKDSVYPAISKISVNSQFNVQAYGAVGDCTTDDTAAFETAQTAAIAAATGKSLPAVLYLPKPPGGCYIVNNLNWKGVSMEGQPSGLGPASPQTYNVALKSTNGRDILHIPDPMTATVKVYPGWSIRNVSFIVDNSKNTAANFPHRWPGRWFDDGAMTAGSAEFTTSAARISCGDVGQAILVTGAGPSGANLVTTIASVTPCWQSPSSPQNFLRVTLADAASTTVTNAHAYIAVLGQPVTQRVGPCAIAADMQDGKASDWKGSLNMGNYGKMENVTFTASSPSTGNPDCGIYTQGNPLLYGFEIRDFMFAGLGNAVVQATTELNSFYQSSSGDYEKWDHGIFFFNYSPWISYNGLSQHWADVQITGSSGPQILQNLNTAYDTASGWQISNSGFESPTAPSAYGWRVEGTGHWFNGVSLTSGAKGQIAYWDANVSYWTGGGDNIQLNGYGNQMNGGLGAFVYNSGLNNSGTWNYAANPLDGMPTNYNATLFPYKGSNNVAGRFTSDALLDGNYSTPYNRDDLIIWPQDIMYTLPKWASWSTFFGMDSTSPSGQYMLFSKFAWHYSRFNQFVYGFGRHGNSLVVGTTLPANGALIYFSAKCPSGTTSFSIALGAYGGSQAPGSFQCTTSWRTYSTPIKWQPSDVGKFFSIGTVGGNSFQVGWLVIRPFINDINGDPIGDFARTNKLPLSGTTARIGGSALHPGQCVTGAVSITGATTSMAVDVSPGEGKSPGSGYVWEGQVTDSNTVTVSVCAIAAGTPNATTYNVRVIP